MTRHSLAVFKIIPIHRTPKHDFGARSTSELQVNGVGVGTDASSQALDATDPRAGKVCLEHAGERYYAMAARTFADARAGDVILYEDSYRNMSVAISRGSAARMLHASPGQKIRITLAR